MIPRHILASFFALALGAAPALAQDALAPQTQNGISFISGGVGAEGRDALRQAAANGYNLRLMFAIQGSGDYLADIKVTLADTTGKTLVAATADGPFFLAKLPPGSYRVAADNAGAVMTKLVTVAAKGTASASFYWPAK